MVRLTVGLLTNSIFFLVTTAVAQTPVRAPENRHNIQTDLRISEIVKDKIHSKLPLIRDERIANYLQKVATRLEAGLPPEFRYNDFKYNFYIIDFSGIAVFAIPGGTIYVSRGAVEKVAGEGELIALMAHGISHVALRHYTAKLPETEKIDWQSLEINILSTFVKGVPGYVDYSRTPHGNYMLRFDDEMESQADIFAAQVLARAKGDPRDLGNVYSRIGYDQNDTGYCPSNRDTYKRKRMLYAEAELLQSAGLYDPHKVAFMSPDFLLIQKIITAMPRRKGEFIYQK